VIDRRLLLLAAGAFVVASDGTLIVGLLRQIADSIAVSPATAGQAVTVFAAVYALGVPLLIRAARYVGRKQLLLTALALFAFANAATAAAPSLLALLGARILAAASAGVFMATASAIAADTLPRERRGRGLAAVVGAASAGTALGVPLGTLLGGAVGWRTAFYGIATLTTVVAVSTAAALPPSYEVPRVAAQMPIDRRRILLTLATTLLWATGSFTFFTYIAVVLRHTASVDSSGLAGFLLLFGVAGIGGAGLAGWLTDTKGALPTLTGALALVTASLTGLGLTAALAGGGAAIAGSAMSIAVYGIGTWAVTPPQQHRLLEGGGDNRLLLSLNASAIYAGVALGSAIGGAILAATTSSVAVCLAAAGIELVALTAIVAGLVLSAPGRTAVVRDIPEHWPRSGRH
jgi:MFS transporter, DHA1 family, inner membrane transport protein